MTRLCDIPRSILLICLGAAVLLLGACAPTAAAPSAQNSTPQPPVIQTVEIEVTRVVYRETLVTPTPAPLAPCSPAALSEAGEVVIGALLPLSTPGVWARTANMQSGLNLGLERLSATGIGGVPVRLAIYDTGDDPLRSVQRAEQLITQDCAAGLIVGLGDAATQAVMEVAERYRKPALLIDSSAAALMESQPSASFRLAPAQPMLAAKPADWLSAVGDSGDFNGDGARQAVIIAENSVLGDMFVEQTNEWFVAAGIDVEIHRVDLPVTDFSPEIARLLAMPAIPDAVFIVINADNALDLQAQLFDAGIRPDKGTLVVSQSRRTLDPVAYSRRPASDAGMIVARRGPWLSNATEAGQAIFDRYRQNALAWPELSTFLAYDALFLLADAMQRAPSLNGADLIQALEQSDVELSAGRYTFPYGASQPPDGVTVPAYSWHQWMTPPLLYLMSTEEGQDPATFGVIWPEGYRTIPGP